MRFLTSLNLYDAAYVVLVGDVVDPYSCISFVALNFVLLLLPLVFAAVSAYTGANVACSDADALHKLLLMQHCTWKQKRRMLLAILRLV